MTISSMLFIIRVYFHTPLNISNTSIYIYYSTLCPLCVCDYRNFYIEIKTYSLLGIFWDIKQNLGLSE